MIPVRTPALVGVDSLAYMIFRRGEGTHQLGSAGYGPGGTDLAQHLTKIIDMWSRARTTAPELRIHSRSNAIAATSTTRVVAKQESSIVVSYP